MRVETPSLLIADDDLQFGETLRNAFEPLGYQTLLAGDGEEAIDIVRTHEVHLILLDMHMPRLTGLETIRLLRQFKAMLPFILMSARLDEQIIEQAAREHAISILAKPVAFRKLTGVIGEALQRIYNWSPPQAGGGPASRGGAEPGGNG